MKRVASIDIFRALTMLLMLWVNDYAGMQGIPHWMMHAGTREDMLGLADIAFPSFLFCMGMSIPHAIENRLGKGDGLARTSLHVLLRCFALLVMGIYEQNTSSHAYELLMAVGFFLVWNAYPDYGRDDRRKWIPVGLRTLGIGILAGLAASVWPMRTGWWGILGLIGWAYLFSSILYLCLRTIKPALPLAWAAIVVMMILSHSHLHVGGWLPGGWSLLALSFSGLMCTSMTTALKERNVPGKFPLYAVVCALLCVAGFVICHRWWHISKNIATPTWVFLCTAIDLAVMAVLYYVADLRGHSGWARPIRAAGVATLTCYQIPYIWYPFKGIIGLRLPEWMFTGVPGLVKAMVFSLAVILVAELLGKIHIRLKI